MHNKYRFLIVLVLLATVLCTCAPTTIYAVGNDSSASASELISAVDNGSSASVSEPISTDYTVTYHNYETNETRISSTADRTKYDYTCSYECMDPSDLELSIQADAEYFRRQANAIAPQSASRSSTVQVVDPSSYFLYSGVLLIAVYATNPYGIVEPYCYGSGFLAGGKTIVTAAHVAAPTLDDGWSNPQVRVYYNLHFSASSDPYGDLDSYPYYTVYDCQHGSAESISTDWYVGTLSSTINGAYYFNCYVVDSSVVGEDTFSVGYASTNKFLKCESQGVALEYWPQLNNLFMSNTIVSGMSGGPIYSYYNGRNCIAINRAYNSTTRNGHGTLITDKIFDYIVDSILS